MVNEETSALNFLKYYEGLIHPSFGIIKYLGEEDDYYGDEPRFITYRAELASTKNLSSGGYINSPAEGGRSMSKEIAKLKAIFEAAERYSLSIYQKKELIFDNYINLNSSGAEVIDPVSFISYEKSKNECYINYIRESKMNWDLTWSWKKNKKVLIPAQLIYLPYNFMQDEPLLRDPLTTGAAAGMSFGKAILRGLLEVIERDATTIIHYSRLIRPKISKELLKHPSILPLINEIESCQLDINIYDFSLDLPVPIVGVIIKDRTGKGPAITVGANSSLDFYESIEGAIFEAACFRRPMRKRMKQANKIFKKFKDNYKGITSGELRAYLWLNSTMINELNYLDSEEYSSSLTNFMGPTSENVENLINQSLDFGGDIFISDIAKKEISSFGIKVVKVIVPNLQPMHLAESDICWSKRIFDISKGHFNQVPHPFL